MATFKKIQDGTPDEIRVRIAKQYREHVKACTRCSCAEHRLRPAQFRCEEGNRLLKSCTWF